MKLLIQEGKAANEDEAKVWISKQTPAQLETYLRALPADKLVTVFGATAIRMQPFPHLFRDGTVIPKKALMRSTVANIRRCLCCSAVWRRNSPLLHSEIPTSHHPSRMEHCSQIRRKPLNMRLQSKYGSEAYAGFNAERVAEKLTSAAGQPPVYAYRFAWEPSLASSLTVCVPC